MLIPLVILIFLDVTLICVQCFETLCHKRYINCLYYYFLLLLKQFSASFFSPLRCLSFMDGRPFFSLSFCLSLWRSSSSFSFFRSSRSLSLSLSLSLCLSLCLSLSLSLSRSRSRSLRSRERDLRLRDRLLERDRRFRFDLDLDLDREVDLDLERDLLRERLLFFGVCDLKKIHHLLIIQASDVVFRKRCHLKDKVEFWSCDYIVKEMLWNLSSKWLIL